MTKNTVDKAFQNLLSDIDQYIDHLKDQSILAIQLDELNKGQEILEIVKKVAGYHSRVLNTFNEWTKEIFEPPSTESQAERFLHALNATKKSNFSNSKSSFSQHKNNIMNLNIPTDQIEIIALDPNDLGSLSFTHVIEGTLGNITVENVGWSAFLEKGIQGAFQEGISFDKLDSKLNLNMRQGAFNKHGFIAIPNTNVSLQRVDANRSAKGLISLAGILQCNLNAIIKWSNN